MAIEYKDCYLYHDVIQNRIRLEDPNTGLCIWESDPGEDIRTYISVPRTFIERVEFWCMANLWVVPSSLTWKQTKFKLKRKQRTYNNRHKVIEEMYDKLKRHKLVVK